jgi:hypothetical protein
LARRITIAPINSVKDTIICMRIYLYQTIILLQTAILVVAIGLLSDSLGLPYIGALAILVIIFINSLGHLPVLYILNAYPLSKGDQLRELVNKFGVQAGAGELKIYISPVLHGDIVLARSWFSDKVVILGHKFDGQLSEAEKSELLISAILLFRSGIIALRTTFTLLVLTALLPQYLFIGQFQSSRKKRYILYALYYLLLPIRLLKITLNQLLSVRNELLKTFKHRSTDDTTTLFTALGKVDCGKSKQTAIQSDLVDGLSICREHFTKSNER